jgi:hypothetical protein
MNLIYMYSFTSITRSYGFLYEIRTGVSDLFPALKGGVPVDGRSGITSPWFWDF